MRWTVVAAVCGGLAACGGAERPRVVEQRTAAPAPSSLQFAEAPLVIVDDGGGVNVWVRLNRSLRDNEGALGEYAGADAAIEIAGTTPDIPGLYRDDSHHTQRANGQATIGIVVIALGLGVACLVVLGLALTRAASLWQMGRLGALAWFAGALALWLMWGLARVIEDSS